MEDNTKVQETPAQKGDLRRTRSTIGLVDERTLLKRKADINKGGLKEEEPHLQELKKVHV